MYFTECTGAQYMLAICVVGGWFEELNSKIIIKTRLLDRLPSPKWLKMFFFIKPVNSVFFNRGVACLKPYLWFVRRHS